MLTRLLFTLAVLALFPDFACAESQDIPAALALPQGAILLGQYAAKGVQIVAYVNTSVASKGPQTHGTSRPLKPSLSTRKDRPFAKHYAGPTWEAPDGSKAVGKVLVNENAPKAGAIPWLLLSAEILSIWESLPACVLSGESTPPAESRRPACVRRSAQSSVSITRPITSFTSNPVRARPKANGLALSMHGARAQASFRFSARSNLSGPSLLASAIDVNRTEVVGIRGRRAI